MSTINNNSEAIGPDSGRAKHQEQKEELAFTPKNEQILSGIAISRRRSAIALAMRNNTDADRDDCCSTAEPNDESWSNMGNSF